MTAQGKRWIEEKKADPGGLHPKPRMWERGPTGRLIVEIPESRTSGHAGRWVDADEKGAEQHAASIVSIAEYRAGSAEARHASEERARAFYRRHAEEDREFAVE